MQRYAIRVRALSNGGISDPSNELLVRVGSIEAWMAPRNFRALVSEFGALLLWDAPLDVSELAGYVIEAGLSPGSTVLVSPVTAARSMVVPAIPAGVYHVRAVSVVSSSRRAVSNEITITIGDPPACIAPPGPPGNLRWSVSSAEVHLNWTSPAAGSPPTQYLLHVGTALGAADLGVFPLDARTTSFSTLAPAGSYFMRMIARNSCGMSPPSNEISIVIPP